MNEIEKMYENAKVTLIVMENDCTYNAHPFTGEKQITLLRFILSHPQCFKYFKFIFCCDFCFRDEDIAKVINANWQDLTEEEKEQIRDILK